MVALDGVDDVKRLMDELMGKVITLTGVAYGKSIADAERKAKETAPWTDRTTNARNSIKGYGPIKKGDGFICYLTIGVDYGRYLELSNGGKYRVIWPTIEAERANLIKNLEGVLK